MGVEMMKWIFIGMVLLLAVACVQKEEPTVTEVPAEVEEKPVVKTPLKVTGAVVTKSTELLSDISCDQRVVTLTFTNTGTKQVKVSDVDFIVNGNLDVDPQCADNVLAPGEGTVCSGLEALGVGKSNVVQVIMPDREQALEKVTCE